MRTRSILAQEILEERQKRRSKRKEREIEELLRATGYQRPRTELFDGNPVRRTRNHTAKEASHLSTIQVVIESQPREQDSGSRPPTTHQQKKESLFTETEVVENLKPQNSHIGTSVLEPEIFFRDSFLDNPEKPSEAALSLPPTPDAPLSQAEKPKKQCVRLKSTARKRLRAVRYAINQTLRNPCKTNSGILKALKKTERHLRLKANRVVKIEGVRSQELEKASSKSINRPVSLITPPLQSLVGPSSTRESPGTPKEALASSRLSPRRNSPGEYQKQALQKSEISHTLTQTAHRVVISTTMAVQEPSQDQGSQIFELTDQCHHYTHIGEVEYDIQKYWQQRYSIWSLYNEGIYMTDDAWFGVTPEPVANKVAEDFAAIVPESKTILIDMFAGAGGNVIAFALSERWSKIIAIEKDISVLACAQHNASIYGVADQITWINDDSFAYLAKHASSIDPSQTVIFASPPWGGPRYEEGEIYNLNKMQPYGIKQIHDAVKTMDSALYLPRGSDLRQIARLAPGEKKIEVVQYCMQGASKAMVAYIPAATPAT